MGGHAKTPQPPYYATVFTSQRTEGDRVYSKMAEKLEDRLLYNKDF